MGLHVAFSHKIARASKRNAFLLSIDLGLCRIFNHIFSMLTTFTTTIEKEESLEGREYCLTLMYSDVKEPFDTLSIHTA